MKTIAVDPERLSDYLYDEAILRTRLKELIELEIQSGSSKQKIADQVGMTVTTINKILNGTTADPGYTKVYAFACHYKVSADYLMGLTDNAFSSMPESVKDNPDADSASMGITTPGILFGLRELDALIKDDRERDYAVIALEQLLRQEEGVAVLSALGRCITRNTDEQLVKREDLDFLQELIEQKDWKKLQKAIEAIKSDYSDRNKKSLIEGTYYADVIGTVSKFLRMEEAARQAVIKRLDEIYIDKKAEIKELLEDSLPPATFEKIEDIL